MTAFRANSEAMRTFIRDRAPTGHEDSITVTEEELLNLDAAIVEEHKNPHFPVRNLATLKHQPHPFQNSKAS